VIGAGAVGLPAAIACREAGASVVLVEAENHVGGHAAASGVTIVLGGGTAAQKKAGILDSPDLYFRDLTDWSVVEPNGFPDYRYNDREIVRAFVEESPAAYDWLVGHEVVFEDKSQMTSMACRPGTQLRVRCTLPRWIGRTSGPASPSNPRAKQLRPSA
jgi:succinate dehydrogenase/fumarate reductase flavoprotein subunit